MGRVVFIVQAPFGFVFLLLSWILISCNMGFGEMSKEMIKKLIKLLTMVILTGTMVIWVMMPTSTYKKIWLPSMRAKLGESIYYGKPGKSHQLLYIISNRYNFKSI